MLMDAKGIIRRTEDILRNDYQTRSIRAEMTRQLEDFIALARPVKR